MVSLNIEDYSQSGCKIQKRIAVFAAFQHDGITLAYPVAGIQQGQITADHDRGIKTRFHENVGHHGSCGGLAMGTGNTDRILICLHNDTPGLGTLK